jgi:hypothetical protein
MVLSTPPPPQLTSHLSFLSLRLEALSILASRVVGIEDKCPRQQNSVILLLDGSSSHNVVFIVNLDGEFSNSSNRQIALFGGKKIV